MKDQKWGKDIKSLTWEREREEWVWIQHGKGKGYESREYTAVWVCLSDCYIWCYELCEMKWDKLRKRVFLHIFLYGHNLEKKCTCCSVMLAGFGNLVIVIFLPPSVIPFSVSKQTIFLNLTNFLCSFAVTSSSLWNTNF